jgi:hypothetical protein
MIDFTNMGGWRSSEFPDLDHTGNALILVPLIIPKFAAAPSRELRRPAEWGR